MHRAPPHLTALVRSAVDALCYELVGVEYLSQSRSGHLLRIYIDSEQGVGLEDCERVSHQVSGVLEVEDPISGEYALEVSSPGLDRPLFERSHFEQFAGQRARVKMNSVLDGRSNYRGVILEIDGEDLMMRVEGESVRLPLAQISAARLVPEV